MVDIQGVSSSSLPVSISSNSPAPAKVTPSWNREKWSWGDSHNEHDRVHSINLRPVPVQCKSVVRKSHLSASIIHFHCHISAAWWITVAVKLDSLESRFLPIGLFYRNLTGVWRTEAFPLRTDPDWIPRGEPPDVSDWLTEILQSVRELFSISGVWSHARLSLLQTWHTCQQTQLWLKWSRGHSQGFVFARTAWSTQVQMHHIAKLTDEKHVHCEDLWYWLLKTQISWNSAH